MDPLLKIYSKMNELSKVPKDFGTGELLYTSEIHTIAVIGKNPGTNLTQIADILGVSKSATSKFVKKLLTKNYITKNKATNSNREVMFHLTDKGEIAFKGHEAFKVTIFNDVNKIIENTSEEELQIIEKFLSAIYQAL
jgi:DNA-binding MarR family transcriptional regulator